MAHTNNRSPPIRARSTICFLNSTEFDSVADPSGILGNASSPYYYADDTHLWPSGYQIVADLVTRATQQLLSTLAKTAGLPQRIRNREFKDRPICLPRWSLTEVRRLSRSPAKSETQAPAARREQQQPAKRRPGVEERPPLKLKVRRSNRQIQASRIQTGFGPLSAGLRTLDWTRMTRAEGSRSFFTV